MSSKKASVPANGVSVDAATLLHQVDGLFPAGDAARATAFADMATIRSARTHVLQRVRDRVAHTDTAKAAALDARLAEDRELAHSFVALGELAAKPPVVAEELETVVHGFVRDADGNAVAGVKVELAQPKGEPVATVTSGKDGHFVVRTRAATKAELPSSLELRVHDRRHPTPVTVERGSTGVTFTTVRLEA